MTCFHFKEKGSQGIDITGVSEWSSCRDLNVSRNRQVFVPTAGAFCFQTFELL